MSNTIEHVMDACSCRGKTCTKCHKKQCCHAFSRDTWNADGLHRQCRSCCSKARAEHRKAHPDMSCVSRHNYRARQRKTAATLTAWQWLALKSRYAYRCLCCGKQEPEITLTVDHVIPLSKGGPTQLSNIQPLCVTCNKKKNTNSTDYRLLASKHERLEP